MCEFHVNIRKLFFIYIYNINLFIRETIYLMRPVTKKWLFLKISSFILIPLMLWFIINFVSFYDKNYQEILKFLTTQPSKFLFSLFLIFAYFFSALSISEVFEDYIHDEKIKNAANKTLNIFAIFFPLITIIIIFNLSL